MLRTNASAIYTATYTQMDAEFCNSRLVATVGLSTFVLGIAWGFTWSPLAEFYGRRPIYLCSFAAYVVWIIPSAVAQNIQTMLVVRFFQGLAGSAFLSVSGGTVGDLFARKDMQAPMAVFTLAPFIGPSTGPIFGGLINYFTSWRWTYYMLIIWSSCILAMLALFVPETYRMFSPSQHDISWASGTTTADSSRPSVAEEESPEAPEGDRRRQVDGTDGEVTKVTRDDGQVRLYPSFPDPGVRADGFDLGPLLGHSARHPVPVLRRVPAGIHQQPLL